MEKERIREISQKAVSVAKFAKSNYWGVLIIGGIIITIIIIIGYFTKGVN